jgi:hypothetical protein
MPQTDDLGDEFALYASESLEWAHATYDAWAESIRQLDGWARVRESHELARLIDKGGFDMTCQRCGEGKAADGDDWCARCEDEDAAEALAALRGASDG